MTTRFQEAASSLKSNSSFNKCLETDNYKIPDFSLSPGRVVMANNLRHDRRVLAGRQLFREFDVEQKRFGKGMEEGYVSL